MLREWIQEDFSPINREEVHKTLIPKAINTIAYTFFSWSCYFIDFYITIEFA